MTKAIKFTYDPPNTNLDFLKVGLGTYFEDPANKLAIGVLDDSKESPSIGVIVNKAETLAYVRELNGRVPIKILTGDPIQGTFTNCTDAELVSMVDNFFSSNSLDE